MKKSAKTPGHPSLGDGDLFNPMPEGFVYGKMIIKKGHPDDFILLYVNPSFERLTGFHDIQGRRITEVIPDFLELYPEIAEAFGQAVKYGESRKIEIRLKESGSWLTFSIYRPEKGKFIALVENITGRKSAEEAFKNSEDRYLQLVENSPDAIAVHAEGKIVYLNPSAMRLMGAKCLKDLLGKPALDLVHPEEREKIRSRIAGVITEGKTAIMERERFIRLDGSTVEVEVVATAILFENKPAVQVVARDLMERKQAELKLKESEEKYRNLVDHANEGIVVIQDLKLKFVNNRAQLFTGCREQELLTRPFLDFVFPDDRNRVLENNLKRLQNDEPIPVYSIRMVDHENLIRWVDVNGVKIVWEGKPAALLFLSDIGDRKQAELDLIKSELMNRTLVNHIPQRIFIKDLNSRYLLFNENYSRDLGIRPDEIVGRDDYEFFPADYVEKYQWDDRQVISDGVTRSFVERYMISGQERWTYVIKVPFRNEENRIVGVLGIFDDITERKEAEEHIHMQSAALQSAANAIIITDPKGTILQANKAFENLTGYNENEIIGRNPRELIKSGLNDPSLYKNLWTTISGGNIWQNELINRRKDGSHFYEEMTITPLKNEDGKITHFIAIKRDITERKKAEEEISKLNNELEYRIEQRTFQLETSLKEMEEFTYTISHDLRAPLRSLNGYARIIEEEHSADINEEGRRYLSIIRKNAVKMGNLIDDLLAFSRLNRKKMVVDLIDMDKLVREVIREVSGKSSRAKILIKNLHPAYGDYSLITQAWLNLISNAIKYSSGAANPEIAIESVKGEAETTYSVRDNGAGFNMKYKDKLFGVFQRLHGESEFEGTGIGLATVKRIVTRHNGKVWAEGKINEGATFYFTLPVAGK